MPDIPRDRSLDLTLDLLRDGYGFISKRCRRLGSDVFTARLMLRPAVCMQGEEAARAFYQPGPSPGAGLCRPTRWRCSRTMAVRRPWTARPITGARACSCP